MRRAVTLLIYVFVSALAWLAANVLADAGFDMKAVAAFLTGYIAANSFWRDTE